MSPKIDFSVEDSGDGEVFGSVPGQSLTDVGTVELNLDNALGIPIPMAAAEDVWKCFPTKRAGTKAAPTIPGGRPINTSLIGALRQFPPAGMVDGVVCPSCAGVLGDDGTCHNSGCASEWR